MPLKTSPEQPAPVRQIAKLVADWINRLGWVWIEGQVAQLTRRPGTRTVFLSLRDTHADISVSVTCPRDVFDSVSPPIVEGAKVLVSARPDYYVARGQFSLRAQEIRPVGLGELLARIERLRQLLAAEGLFGRVRKKPLPFVPSRVGVVCGRDSAAERDVVDNARRRWPAVRFRVENVAVQGPYSAGQVIEALHRLDEDPSVDVIVITRGGGSVEDLLPFSDEGLLRAVARCQTPVVSAIGHEQDGPLLDLVADFRASTPTDAGRRVVPDVAEEMHRLTATLQRARHAVRTRVTTEQQGLAALRSRPALAAPRRDVEARAYEVRRLVDRSRRSLSNQIDRSASDVGHCIARVRSLSPQATLDRGYAVLQTADGRVIRTAGDVKHSDHLDVRVADGRFDVVVTTPDPG